eukprot:CAMPEP_0198137142 /NCGR_PEP_ID=MMETSP1443-20131203/677_1 /TAXON_ID=186043 /ORGANISM="Entomoneis sp., Strain CCMP2396" /LENGTH=164 /DNA_ID=CAMNT_0043798481 /DNA_START=22 /DNA_END=513 /DNA_ORIENTATION=-
MAILTLRHGITAASRRHFSSGVKNHPNVGVIARRKNPSTSAEAAEAPVSKRVPPHQLPSEIVVISPEIRRNNILMGLALFATAGGIVAYSIIAVGQAGSSGDGGDDPLEVLKKEAAEAQGKKDQETKDLADTQAMVDKVQSGAYDPDNYEDMEEEMEQKKKRIW